MSFPSRLDAVAARLGRVDTWVRAVTRLVLLAVVIVGAGVLLAASLAPTASVASTAIATVDRDVLDFPPLPEGLAEPPERSVVLARDGSVLAILHGVENREIVDLDDVPRHVLDAVLATEDARFFEHEGVNWRAVARAGLGNLRAGKVTSGGSTITQQLVKNAVLKDTSRTVTRKLREAVYAIELERRLSKDEILASYLNLAYFGNGVYGIGTAAEYYFDRDVADLTVAQGALLAGLIRAPGDNDPIDHPRAAKGRRNIVLTQMADEGWLDPDKAARLRARGLRLRLTNRPPSSGSLFVTYVRELLKDEPALGPTRAARDRVILRGGLTIKTTLDPRLQRVARDAITEVLTARDGPQAALTAVDPRSGEILAIGVGPKRFGNGPGQTQVTPAVRGLGSPAGRQAGSAFKPFQIVAALEHGISPAYTFKAGDSYTTRSRECRDSEKKPYKVGNYSDASQGTLDMAGATAKSSNTYFTRLLDLTGPAKLVEVAERMGITADFGTPFCSYVLGTKDVYGLDMASAYGTLANEGVHCRPYAITAVVDRRGRTLIRNGEQCTRAVEEGIAARATKLLRGPIEAGTASTNGQIGRPAAGKTGTTNNYRDAWFVGYVPQLSASTWVGDPRRTRVITDSRCTDGRVTGGCLPTMIWSTFMRRAVDVLDLPVAKFPKPPRLPRATVPNVVGSPAVSARPLLEGLGFEVAVDTTDDYRPAGTVLSQQPAAGTRVPEGTGVTLTVSNGSARAAQVPDLVGLTVGEADAVLADAGIAGTVAPVPVTD
ncbi:MAG: transglycosylase domain-containing protein, partial [Actinomycetota bacterium]|nr:transglycosylase domain-containing protein [Actinomycetota bacterium]